MLKEGSIAPDFSLRDQADKLHKLSDYKGHWIFLYFYPKDDTPGCTKEACGIRDVYKKFKNKKVWVFGVSKDSTKRHLSFAEKYNLPFTLLSDVTTKMIESYGAWAEKKMMGREYMGILRVSYLINPEGKIAKAYPKVVPAEHAEQILSDLEQLM